MAKRSLVWEDSREADTGQSYRSFVPGTYTGKLASTKAITAKTGNTGLAWEFEVEGLKFSLATWDEGRGGWKERQIVHALGIEGVDGETLEYDPERLLGKTCLVVIDENDRGYKEVVRCMPLPTGDEIIVADELVEPQQSSMFDDLDEL